MGCEALATKSDVQQVLSVVTQILEIVQAIKCDVDLTPVLAAVASAENTINLNVNHTRDYVAGAVYDTASSILNAINALDFDCIVNVPPVTVPPCDLNPVINAIQGAESSINSNVNYSRQFVAGAVYDAEQMILNAINGIDCAEQITNIDNNFNDFSTTLNDYSLNIQSSLTNVLNATYNQITDTINNSFNEFTTNLDTYNNNYLNNFNDFSNTITNNFNDFSSLITQNIDNNYNNLINNFNDFGVELSNEINNTFNASYENISNQYDSVINNLGDITYDNSVITTNLTEIKTDISNITTTIDSSTETIVYTLDNALKLDGLTWKSGECTDPKTAGDWYSYESNFNSGAVANLASAFSLLNNQLEKIHEDVCKGVEYKIVPPEKPMPVQCSKTEDGELQVTGMSVEQASLLPWFGVQIAEGVAGWVIGQLLDQVWQSNYTNQQQVLQGLCEVQEQACSVLLPDPGAIIANKGKYLIITWVDPSDLTGFSYNSQTQIADPIPELWNGTEEELANSGNWEKYFANISWVTGNVWGQFYVEQRTPPLARGFFKDETEGNSIFAWASNLSLLTPLEKNNPRFTTTINSEVNSTPKTRVIRKVVVAEKVPFSEEIKKLVCYVRPKKQLV